MIPWLEDNPVGKMLAAFSGVLVLVILLLVFAWSRPPHGAEDDGQGDGREFSVDVPELESTAPIEQFAVITERPVFNESRQPEIFAEETGDEQAEEQWAEVQVDAPDVQLAGVVITPSLRVATLRSKDSTESLIALEGQPLEGNYGSWRVSQVDPRSVVLRSGNGEEVRLDLVIHDAMIEAPPEPPPAAREAGAAAGSGAEEPMSRAEEIRQRIAERREELRRAAEQEQGQQTEDEEQDKPSAPADYRSAIQQLIQGRRTETNDENDQ